MYVCHVTCISMYVCRWPWLGLCKLCFFKCYAPILTFWPIIPRCFAHYASNFSHNSHKIGGKYQVWHRDILQHDRRFDIVVHIAGLSITWQEWKLVLMPLKLTEWQKLMLSTNVVGPPYVSFRQCAHLIRLGCLQWRQAVYIVTSTNCMLPISGRQPTCTVLYL